MRHSELVSLAAPASGRSRRRGCPTPTFHELRHWCGHHFYVTLGFSAEEAGAQLGHKDGRQIVQTYGHGRQGGLQRLHRGTEPQAEIRSTQTPRATQGEVV